MIPPLPMLDPRNTPQAESGTGGGEGDEECGMGNALYLRKSLRDGGLLGAGADASERGPVLQPGPSGASCIERRGLKHRASAGRLRPMSEYFS